MVTAVLGIVVAFSIGISLVNGLKPVITRVDLFCWMGFFFVFWFGFF